MVLLSADWTFIHFVQSSPGLAKVKRILQDMRISHARNITYQNVYQLENIMILKIDIDGYISNFQSNNAMQCYYYKFKKSTYRFNLKDFHQGSHITFQLKTMRRPFIKSYSTSDKFQFELFRENLFKKAVSSSFLSNRKL